MNKIIYFLLLLIILCIPFSTVLAEEKFNISDTGTTIQFPSSLNFFIKADSLSTITKIRLQYQVQRMNFTNVVSEAWPSFAPSTKVAATWIWDMRKFSLPPFASVKYWWIVENKNGEKITSPEKTLSFNDNRYSWQEITTDKIHLSWYEGNKAFANELMTAGEEALFRLNQDTSALLINRAEIYIYGKTDDLQKAMVNPREWTGGAAFYEFNIIAIGISTKELDWGKTAIAHELGHLVTHQLTFGPYESMLPTWLDEGLAMHAEGKMDKDTQTRLLKIYSQNKLLSLRSLSSPFSAKTKEALLSYMQSQSVIEFLIENYGKEAMSKLLVIFKNGSDSDTALQTIYGFDQDGLEGKWKDWLKTLSEKPN